MMTMMKILVGTMITGGARAIAESCWRDSYKNSTTNNVVVIDDVSDSRTLRELHAAILDADGGKVDVPKAIAATLTDLFPEAGWTPAMLPSTINVGPVTEHHDTTGHLDQNDITVLMWTNDDPESHLRFFDDHHEVANVEVKAGRAVAFDNHRLKHQLDGPKTSRRALLGPMTFNSVIGDFMSGGGGYQCDFLCYELGCCTPPGTVVPPNRLRSRKLQELTCTSPDCIYYSETTGYSLLNCEEFCELTSAPTMATPVPTSFGGI